VEKQLEGFNSFFVMPVFALANAGIGFTMLLFINNLAIEGGILSNATIRKFN
jgi:Na+/H+ antiporter NhaA